MNAGVGQFFAFEDVFYQRYNTCTVQCSSNFGRLIKFDAESFQKFIMSDDDLTRKMAKFSKERNDIIQKKIMNHNRFNREHKKNTSLQLESNFYDKYNVKKSAKDELFEKLLKSNWNASTPKWSV